MSPNPPGGTVGAADGLLARWVSRAWWSTRPDARARLLGPLAALFGLVTRLNRAAYRRGWRRVHHPGVPVIVVGNLIVGGAGKTPTTIAIVEWLQRAGRHPGVVSRGHGGSDRGPLVVQAGTRAQACGDEPLLIHQRTAAPVVIGRDRAAAAAALRTAHPEVDVIVSDDGLQHHRLGRDVEVVVFDARGIGNGCLLPAGPLRQTLASLTPPEAPGSPLVLYNAAAPSTPRPGFVVMRTLAGAATLVDWRAGHAPSLTALNALRATPVTALAAIAQPQRFFEMLTAIGLQVQGVALADHAPLHALPWSTFHGNVLVTEKDAVKLAPDPPGPTQVWVVRLDFQPPGAFFDALERRLTPHVTTPEPWTID